MNSEFTQAGLVHLRNLTDQLVDDLNAITEQNLQQQRTRKEVHDDYMEGRPRLSLSLSPVATLSYHLPDSHHERRVPA